jgi:hypothetical protein
MYNDLSITIRAETMPQTSQPIPEVSVVVNLPVEDNEDGVIFIENGLTAASPIYNCESSRAERDSVADPCPLVVRSTVANFLAHS